MDRPSYTLADISRCTRMPLERLRYAVDQRLLPGQRRGRDSGPGSRGRGTPRSFLPFEAFSLACATLMLDAGLRRKTVRDCMDLLCSYSVPGSRRPDDVPLYQAFQVRDVSVLEIGDGVHVRLSGSADYRGRELPFGWRHAATRAPLGDYRPLVTVTIDVAQLRQCFV